MNHRLFVSVAALGLAVVSGFGQGTKVDYERAAEIRKRYSGKVYNESLRPNWFGGNQFWYETNVRGESEYVLVNGGKGKRRAAAEPTAMRAGVKRTVSRTDVDARFPEVAPRALC